RDEKTFGDLSIRQAFGDEARDGELRRRQRRPTVRLGLGGDQAPPNAEFAEAAADAAGVPGCAEFGVEGEGTAKTIDGGFSIGRDQFNAEILERGRQLEPSGGALEEIDGFAEVRLTWLEKTAHIGRGGRDRGGGGVQLRSTLAVEQRKLREFVVLGGESDASEHHLVGDIERESREDRSAVRFGWR